MNLFYLILSYKLRKIENVYAKSVFDKSILLIGVTQKIITILIFTECLN